MSPALQFSSSLPLKPMGWTDILPVMILTGIYCGFFITSPHRADSAELGTSVAILHAIGILSVIIEIKPIAPTLFPDLPGGWSEWVTACPVTCGVRYVVLTRSCNNPLPGPNGGPCVDRGDGSSQTNTTTACDEPPCQVQELPSLN